MLAHKLLARKKSEILFVGGSSAERAAGTSGTANLALNSGLTGGIASSVSANDLVIAVFGTGSTANRTLSITDGTNAYTLINAEFYVNENFDLNLRVAYKFMGATPDSATTFGPTGATADGGAIAVFVFRGVSVSNPLDVSEQIAYGTGSKANPPAITPVTANACVLCVAAAGFNSDGKTFTGVAGLSPYLVVSGWSVNDCSVCIGVATANWSSGEVDVGTLTHSYNNSFVDAWGALSIALRPA